MSCTKQDNKYPKWQRIIVAQNPARSDSIRLKDYLSDIFGAAK